MSIVPFEDCQACQLSRCCCGLPNMERLSRRLTTLRGVLTTLRNFGYLWNLGTMRVAEVFFRGVVKVVKVSGFGEI